MPKSKISVKSAKKESAKSYFEAVGRRKSAVARVRIFRKPAPRKDKKQNWLEVNGQDLLSYFPVRELQETVFAPFKKTKTEKEFFVSVKISGGGIKGQAEAARLGISRALLKFNSDLRPALKTEGFLRRDARVKERRKFGLKKARKAPQWSKR